VSKASEGLVSRRAKSGWAGPAGREGRAYKGRARKNINEQRCKRALALKIKLTEFNLKLRMPGPEARPDDKQAWHHGIRVVTNGPGESEPLRTGTCQCP
jgi:hypothetical protein